MGRLLPKYGKVGVAVSREWVTHSSGESSVTYYYLVFKDVQPNVEAPAEVVVAGEQVGEPPAEVVVAGEVVGP